MGVCIYIRIYIRNDHVINITSPRGIVAVTMESSTRDYKLPDHSLILCNAESAIHSKEHNAFLDIQCHDLYFHSYTFNVLENDFVELPLNILRQGLRDLIPNYSAVLDEKHNANRIYIRTTLIRALFSLLNEMLLLLEIIELYEEKCTSEHLFLDKMGKLKEIIRTCVPSLSLQRLSFGLDLQDRLSQAAIKMLLILSEKLES